MAASGSGQRKFTAGEKIAALFLVSVVGLACVESWTDEDESDDGARDTESSAPLLSGDGGASGIHELAVSQSGFTQWPFTVSAGVLRCRQGVQVTFEEPGGLEYGVNGTAQDAGYPSVLPIWALDPALGHGLRVNISEVLDKGRTLC